MSAISANFAGVGFHLNQPPSGFSSERDLSPGFVGEELTVAIRLGPRSEDVRPQVLPAQLLERLPHGRVLGVVVDHLDEQPRVVELCQGAQRRAVRGGDGVVGAMPLGCGRQHDHAGRLRAMTLKRPTVSEDRAPARFEELLSCAVQQAAPLTLLKQTKALCEGASG